MSSPECISCGIGPSALPMLAIPTLPISHQGKDGSSDGDEMPGRGLREFFRADVGALSRSQKRPFEDNPDRLGQRLQIVSSFEIVAPEGGSAAGLRSRLLDLGHYGRALAVIALSCIFISLASISEAQEITLSLGGDDTLAGRAVQLFVLVTVLSLVPALAIMITCFPFIVTVLAILRQAIGLQQSPPNMLIVSLALFLTWFVMEPVFLSAWEAGGQPLMDGTMSIEQGFSEAIAPFRIFMAARIDPGVFGTMVDLRPDVVTTDPGSGPLSVLVPSFLLSEVERAFEVGFLIFLPFLIIDLVVAAVLMSMGMMMVPPAIVSLPFKLAFFVVADGWSLIAASLVRSYS